MQDEEALRAIVAGMESAWNRMDAEAWGSVFAEDADFIHVLGLHFTGRQTIVEGHRAIFDTVYKDSAYVLAIEKIRPLGPDAAVVFTLADLTLADGSVLRARPTLVAERTPSGWRIAAFQNTLVGQPSASGAAEALARHPHQAD